VIWLLTHCFKLLTFLHLSLIAIAIHYYINGKQFETFAKNRQDFVVLDSEIIVKSRGGMASMYNASLKQTCDFYESVVLAVEQN